MDSDGRRTKRDAANERLRAGFLMQAGPKLVELCELFRDDPSPAVRSTVQHELGRLADTARALKITTLASVASTAATNLTEDPGMWRAVARAIRAAHRPPLLGHLVIVGRGDPAARWRAQATEISEPVQIVPSIQAWAGGLVVQSPTALVVPTEALDEARGLAEDPLPLIAYGAGAGDLPANAEDPRVIAARAGALTSLPADFTLPELVQRTRWLQYRHGGGLPIPGAAPDLGAPKVWLRIPSGPLQDRWSAALKDAGARVLLDEESSIFEGVRREKPAALLLGEGAQGSVDPLIRALRGQPYGEALFIAGVGDARQAEAHWEAGADAFFEADEEASGAARHLLRQLARRADLPTDLDRLTGLPNRRGILREVDRHVASLGRSRAPLTVALLHLDGLTRLAALHGDALADQATRDLAHSLRSQVRALDLVGRLDHSTFLLGWVGCPPRHAARRLRHLRQRFLSHCRADPRLRELGLGAGLADTEIRATGLVQRAVEALLRAPSPRVDGGPALG